MVFPKAWGLGSPVLIGQAVWITNTKNDKENNKVINDAEDNVDTVTLKTKEVTARNAKRAIENREIAKYRNLLDKAKAIREEKLTESNLEEKPGLCGGIRLLRPY